MATQPLPKQHINISKVETASNRIQDLVKKTAFDKNEYLSDKHDAKVYIKREDMQSVRSFKIRGAYNKIKSLSDAERTRGVICASAGNHAQGFAYACAHLGIKGKIYMPSPTPQQKIKRVKLFGKDKVEIVLGGDTFDDAYESAVRESKSSGACFVHPFNDHDVIEGQSTIALEMLAQQDVSFDYLFVAVGGGGLLSGVGSVFKTLSPNTKIVAVEASGAPAFYNSHESRELVKLDHIDSFADGIAVKRIGDVTFQILNSIVDDKILVPEGKICSTILELYNEEAIVAEPAGAVSISALDLYPESLKGKNIALILCGGNNDITRTEEIRERSLLYEGKKHYFIIRFPQRAGALKEFLNLLGPNDDIAHFEYTKKTNRETGPALVGLEFKNNSDYKTLVGKLNSADIRFEHVNNKPILFEMLI